MPELKDFDPELVDELRDDVQRGVELLDREHPGWFRRVDLSRLHMPDPRYCVLGQIGGMYNDAFQELFPDPNIHPTGTVAVRHGFLAGELQIGDEYDYEERFAILGLLWTEAITARQQQEGARV